MNIITDAAALEKGGIFKQELGAWGFAKSTLSYNSGLLMDDKLALSGTLVRKTGEGYYYGTWTDAWAYYFGASTYFLNDAHKLQFYAVGALKGMDANCIGKILLYTITNLLKVLKITVPLL